MHKKLLLTFLVLLGLFVVTGVSHAADVTWTATSTGNWSTAGNWTPSGIPTGTSTVIFSASSTANCTIDITVNIPQITITSGYSGTITQSSGILIVAWGDGFSQAGGTFNGSSGGGDIEIGASFSLTGGTFRSTSGGLYLVHPSAGAASTTFLNTFQNNSGTVYLDGANFTVTGSSTFNNLWFGDGNLIFNQAITVATGTVLTVNGSLTYGGNNSTAVYLLGGGEIDVKGDVLLNHVLNVPASGTPTSTFNLVLNGTGTQNINDQGHGQDVNPLQLPSVTINKASGVVNLSGFLEVTGNWTNNNGPSGISAGTSTVMLINSAGTITGSSTFYTLQFGQADIPFNSFLTVATGTVLTAQSSTIFFPGSGSWVALKGGGEVDAKGDVVLSSYQIVLPTSTFNFVLNGTSTQTINDNGNSIFDSGFVAGQGNYDEFFLPGLTVNKSSGVAIVSAQLVEVVGNLAVLSGELRFSSSTSPQIFAVDGTASVSSGAILSDYAGATSTIYLGGSATNNGLVFFDGSGSGCTATLPNYVMLRSTSTGAQVPWSGSGNFVMRYVDVKDQAGSASISVLNGTNNGNNGGNWTFTTGPEPQLIQSASNSGGAGTADLALSAFGFKPRAGDLVLVAVSARDQSITAPTDSAGNTYTLVASSTFSASPSYAVGLYYAKNIVSSSSFAVTAHATNAQSGNNFLSASAFEYTGMAPSSSLDTYSTNTSYPATTTSLTSLSATGRSSSELYFGAMTLSASTTASSGSGWTARSGVSNNSTAQALYVEEVASSSLLTIASTWTSITSTSYAAIMGIFRSPFTTGYAASGTLDSATFDTGVVSGAQLNSVIWQGSTPSDSAVKFQFAVSNASGGPWNFEGPDGTANTYFTGTSGTSISLVSTSASQGYLLFNGYRYFRYRVILFADHTFVYTPTVNQVVVNWSP